MTQSVLLTCMYIPVNDLDHEPNHGGRTVDDWDLYLIQNLDLEARNDKGFRRVRKIFILLLKMFEFEGLGISGGEMRRFWGLSPTLSDMFIESKEHCHLDFFLLFAK